MRMFKRVFHKKGVSPLIATVLLIAFAVSLGAVVMNWGRGYVETTIVQVEAQSSEKISCSMDTSMGIVQVGDKIRLCIDDSGDPILRFTLINTGITDIHGIQVTELYTEDADEPPIETSAEIDTVMPASRSKLVQGSLTLGGDGNTTLDQIEQIELAPIIQVRNINTTCLEHAIKRQIAEIRIC